MSRTIARWSVSSMIAKFEAMPMRLPSRRKMRTQIEWNVPTHSSRGLCADHRFEPRLHLAGRFVGEGYGQDAVGEDVFLAEQVRDPVGEDSGLAAAGTGKNENGSFGLLDSITLDVIKSVSLDNHQTVTIRRGGPLRLGAAARRGTCPGGP